MRSGVKRRGEDSELGRALSVAVSGDDSCCVVRCMAREVGRGWGDGMLSGACLAAASVDARFTAFGLVATEVSRAELLELGRALSVAVSGDDSCCVVSCVAREVGRGWGDGVLSGARLAAASVAVRCAVGSLTGSAKSRAGFLPLSVRVR
jgi:hypothetical protein